MRGNKNSSIWAKRVRPILYIWHTKTCIQTGIYKHETAQQRLFPRCVVYLRLSCSSWASFKKITQNNNYPSLAVYRTITKPQRMPVVLTLTETTHVTESKSSFFHPYLFLLTFSDLSDLVYVFSCLSTSTSVCQIKGEEVLYTMSTSSNRLGA